MDTEYLFESIRISGIGFIGATETLTTVWGLMVGLPVLALITTILGGITMKKLNETTIAAMVGMVASIAKLLWNNNEQTQQEFDDACGFLSTKVYNLAALTNNIVVEPAKKLPAMVLQGLTAAAQLAIDIVTVSVLVPFLVACFVAFKCYDFAIYLCYKIGSSVTYAWGVVTHKVGCFVTDCRDKISEIKAAKEEARITRETAEKEARLNAFVSEFGNVIEDIVQSRIDSFVSESNKKNDFVKKYHGLKIRQLRNIAEMLSIPFARTTTKLQLAEAIWSYAKENTFAAVAMVTEHVIPAAQEEQAHV